MVSGKLFQLNLKLTERTKIMDDKKVARINELYHKSKSEGLTPERTKRTADLEKRIYRFFKRNLRGQLNNISIKEKTEVLRI